MNKCSEIQKQINRVKGQVNGVDKMILEGRDSIEIVQQISAIRFALSRLATDLLKDESRECLSKMNEEAKIKRFEELVSNFFKLNN